MSNSHTLAGFLRVRGVEDHVTEEDSVRSEEVKNWQVSVALRLCLWRTRSDLQGLQDIVRKICV